VSALGHPFGDLDAAASHWYCYDPGTNIFGALGPSNTLLFRSNIRPSVFLTTPGPRMISAVVLLFALPTIGQGCPHEGADHRLLGHLGCQVQRKLTIEHARPPRTIWSFHVLKLSVKIDPKHPHLLMEWPARSQRLWRFRVGYRWDANAQAYIFPALAFKKVNGTMTEYQRNSVLQAKDRPAKDRDTGQTSSILHDTAATPRKAAHQEPDEESDHSPGPA